MLFGALVALVVSAAIGSSRAATGDDDVIRQARDRTEIEALMWRYVRALDTNDAEAYAAVYTPDGQFGSGPNATKGREALTKMVADMRQRRSEAEAKGEKRPPMYHVITNPYIEFIDKDRVRYQAYWMTIFGAEGNTQPRVAAAGREYDELVRVNGKWLIKLRDVAPRN
jgi:3-phenylpropionate/cinnamic acid dioxygenase small subunit